MAEETRENIYPGVGRLGYFLTRVMLVIATTFAVVYFGPESSAFRAIALMATVAGLVLDVMRLRNIGVSRWFVFLRFIPWVGVLFSVMLQSAQGGWTESRRLDRAGLAIIGVHLAILALVLYLVFRSQFVGEIFAIPFGG
ncbi:MAG TPA: hypothetical protein PKD26_08685 [Pyrinomonadaceae bacterium]|nr:hypothetical protein [Pyrinomonadaceae bacterium]